MLQSQLGTQAPILIIGLGSQVVADVLSPLIAAGYPVRIGNTKDVNAVPWSLVISAPSIPGMGAIELLAALQQSGNGTPPPLLIISRGGEDPAAEVAPSADGVGRLVWPFEATELVQRVGFMTASGWQDSQRPRAPDGGAMAPPRPSVWSEERFAARLETQCEDLCAGRLAGPDFVAVLRLDELDQFRSKLPAMDESHLWRQVAQVAQIDALADEIVAIGEQGDLLLLLPEYSRHQAARRLGALSRRLTNHVFDLQGQAMQLSPLMGYAPLQAIAAGGEALANAREAVKTAAIYLDLRPVLFKPAKVRAAAPRPPGLVGAWFGAFRARHALVIQYFATMGLGLVLPFCIYWGLNQLGFDISGGVYVFVVVSLTLTALSIWAEGLLALRRIDPPAEPARPYPPASAIIAAYLPNEAPIIEDTIRAFLAVQYPAPLQVILAYNTPRDMPDIEEKLREIARQHPQFIPMRVQASTSKAQNVNAALAHVNGEFVAVFDADHHPDPDSFRRAWRWLSHGADVVQGHCLIRNGDASWVARMIAVEFEQIYAVSHPGRARLHGFGIFGGSNGYWHIGLLRELRMHGFMLTEDIDSSMRAVVRGRRIVSDPYLVSRELAPETLSGLTKQRLRWAQGWFQISMKWMLVALRSRNLSLRQKLGMLQLLAWREIYPWVSMQILPLIAFWVVQEGSFSSIDWFVPLFLVTTLFTLTTGPGQIVFTYLLADPQIRKRGAWFLFFMFTTTFFYGGLKNAWGRMAHLKQALGETAWVVTPRVSTKPRK